MTFTLPIHSNEKSTPRGSDGHIHITVRPEGDMTLLEVRDNGIGITQEDLFHIFEPFYRADMSRVRKIKKSGSGLGLTIINEIVRVHHGKIQIQSALRKGTHVQVYIPKGNDDEVLTELTPISPLLQYHRV